MTHNNKIYGFLFILSLMLLLGCYKDRTVIIPAGEVITRPVSFSGDLIPIFDQSCSISGCHNTGGQSPDLTASNAYNSLTIGGLINTGDPESSELYLWMTGKEATPMPVSGINKEYNALVLAWIQQGGTNN